MKPYRYAALALTLTLLAGCSLFPAEPTATPSEEPSPSAPVITATPTPTAEPTEPPVETTDEPVETTPAVEIQAELILLKDAAIPGAAQMLNDHPEVGYSVADDLQTITQALTDGTADLALLPAGTAAALYNAGAEIQLLALVSQGGLGIYERGESINSLSDLRGKTLHAVGEEGDTPYILSTLWNTEGLTDTDVTLQWHTSAEELAEQLCQGTVDYALLPITSYVAVQESGGRLALEIDEIWAEHSLGETPSVCLVGRKAWMNENPSLLNTLMSAWSASVSYAANKTNTADAAQLTSELGLLEENTASVILGNVFLTIKDETTVIPHLPSAHLFFITGDDMVGEVQSYYQTLFHTDPASIGGTIPDDAFYYLGS